MANFKEDLKKVKAFAFDVDGVLSAYIFLNPDGEQVRSMNMKDGYALQLAVKKGYPVAIITGSHTESIKMRFEGLGITDIYLGSSEKKNDFIDFCFKYDLGPEVVMFMGDDVPDYEVMKMAGIPTCPVNAAEDIKPLARYISAFKGGEGCVRDVIEQVLRAQNKWMDKDAFDW
ncbi:MAG: HAD hydrolase family protein [Bacteroidota bacterium]